MHSGVSYIPIFYLGIASAGTDRTAIPDRLLLFVSPFSRLAFVVRKFTFLNE